MTKLSLGFDRAIKKGMCLIRSISAVLLWSKRALFLLQRTIHPSPYIIISCGQSGWKNEKPLDYHVFQTNISNESPWSGVRMFSRQNRINLLLLLLFRSRLGQDGDVSLMCISKKFSDPKKFPPRRIQTDSFSLALAMFRLGHCLPFIHPCTNEPTNQNNSSWILSVLPHAIRPPT